PATVVRRDRKVRKEAPRLAVVVRFVQTAVVANQNVIRIVRIERDVVMIDVHVERALPLAEPRGALLAPDVAPRPAGILAPLEVRAHGPDRVRLPRVHENFAVVGRTTAAIFRHSRPGRTGVVRLVEAHAVVSRWRRRNFCCTSASRRLSPSATAHPPPPPARPVPPPPRRPLAPPPLAPLRPARRPPRQLCREPHLRPV